MQSTNICEVCPPCQALSWVLVTHSEYGAWGPSAPGGEWRSNGAIRYLPTWQLTGQVKGLGGVPAWLLGWALPGDSPPRSRADCGPGAPPRVPVQVTSLSETGAKNSRPSHTPALQERKAAAPAGRPAAAGLSGRPVAEPCPLFGRRRGGGGGRRFRLKVLSPHSAGSWRSP